MIKIEKTFLADSFYSLTTTIDDNDFTIFQKNLNDSKIFIKKSENDYFIPFSLSVF